MQPPFPTGQATQHHPNASQQPPNLGQAPPHGFPGTNPNFRPMPPPANFRPQGPQPVTSPGAPLSPTGQAPNLIRPPGPQPSGFMPAGSVGGPSSVPLVSSGSVQMRPPMGLGPFPPTQGPPPPGPFGIPQNFSGPSSGVAPVRGPYYPGTQMAPNMYNSGASAVPPVYSGPRPPAGPSSPPTAPPLSGPPVNPTAISPTGSAATSVNQSTLVQSQPQEAVPPQQTPQMPVNSTPTSSRRMPYPKEITQAYLNHTIDPFGGGSVSDTPPQGNQNTNVYGAPPSQGDQFFTPAIPPQSRPPQSNVSSMNQQFGNMNLNYKGTQALQSVPLIGVHPNLNDLDNPAPVPRLAIQAAASQSPTANCPPSYKRCTLNAIPQTQALLSKSKLPFGLVIDPYHCLFPGEEEVPIVNATTIVRCRRCRTYINPYVHFIDGGRRWTCNMCFLPNEVPGDFDYDLSAHKEINRFQRPELTHGVIEFVAPTEYMVRPPQPPIFVFVIDVSAAAVASGAVSVAAKAILDSLDKLPNDEKRTRIGFITVDSTLQFYNLNPAFSEPQMLVVSDLDDLFLPLPDDLLANLSESRPVVESLLRRMDKMFKDTQNPGNALGPALQAAFKLISPIGGKIIVLQASLPGIGVGALKSRQDPKALGTSKESALLQPASTFYKSFAVDCSRAQVSIDLFIIGTQYTDVATLSCVPKYTGGGLYYYPNFQASNQREAARLHYEFSRHLSRPLGLEAVMRVRASKGLRMSAFYGNFFIRSTDLLALPNVSPDNAYSLQVSIEENLQSPLACFQTALLHTTAFGERRIRVLTLAVPVTTELSDVYANVDQAALANLLSKMAVDRALSAKIEDARDALVNKCLDILGTYKTVFGGSGVSPQLMVSDNLKLFPLLILGLIKHTAFRAGAYTSLDQRANAMCQLQIFNSDLVNCSLVPNFYALHTMDTSVGTPIAKNRVSMPIRLNLSAERLETQGIFLLEEGTAAYVWIGRNASQKLIVDLFDAPSYESIPTQLFTLPQLENPFSIRVRAILSQLQGHRPKYLPLVIVKEDGDPALRALFASHLVEDRMGNDTMSYHQFLNLLKEKVQSGSY